jgi:hypothetical protein
MTLLHWWQESDDAFSAIVAGLDVAAALGTGPTLMLRAASASSKL